MTERIKFVILIFILASIRILPMIIVGDYIPDTDNAFQIQSALRLLDGDGLTYISIGDYAAANPDISTPNYVYASGFPPGFALLVAGFIYIGISIYVFMVMINFLLTFLILYGWWVMGNHYNLNKFELMSFILSVFLIILVRNLGVLTDLIAMGIMPIIFYLILKNKISIKTMALAGFLSALIVLFKYSALYIVAGMSLYIAYSYRRNIVALFKYLFIYLTLPISTFLCITIINNYKTSGDSVTNFSQNVFINSFISKFRVEWIFDFLKSVYFGTFRIDDIIIYLFNMIGITVGNLFFYIISLGLLALTIWFCIKLYKRYLTCRDLLVLNNSMFMAAFLLLLFMSSKLASQVWHPLQETRYIIPIIPLLILLVFLIIKHFIDYKKLKNITYISLSITIFLFTALRIIHDITKISEFHNTKRAFNQIIERVSNQYDASAVTVIFSENDYNSMIQIDNKYNAVRDVCVLNKPHHFSRSTLVFIIQDLRQIKTISTQYEVQSFLRDKYLSCQNDVLSQADWSMVEGNGFNLFYYYTKASQTQ